MKSTIETQSMLADAEDLNEMVMEAASQICGDDLPVEDNVGELEENITEQLVSAGNNEADRELRIASAQSRGNDVA